MQGYIERDISSILLKRLKNFPVVALLGPRQCGKSTLAHYILKTTQDSFVYLDLEKPSDMAKLTDPERFFQVNKDSLICIDEIQRSPNLFTIIRSFVDESKKMGQILILGSSSQDLLNQYKTKAAS